MFKKIKQKTREFIRAAAYQKHEYSTQIQQIQLVNQFRLMKNTLSPSEMPKLDQVGFKNFSQFEEDGQLLYIFTIIGTTNKKVLEICAGDGRECMGTNLIINHGWEGLLFDGSETAVEQGNSFFQSQKNTSLLPPAFKHAWLTIDNVNQLVSSNNFNGTIDLFSLDIDGNDYHIMKALTVVEPRVIVCETHNVVPGDKALTIQYEAEFNRMNGPHPDFMSVSLLAMKKLLSQKGYRLIGGHQYGFNVYFMKNGIGETYFPEVSIETIHNNKYTKLRREIWSEVKDLPWLEV